VGVYFPRALSHYPAERFGNGECGMNMQTRHDIRTESALYWSAVSLIVCEGLPIDKAAERLGVDDEALRDILHRRQTLRPFSADSNRQGPQLQ
jgi:hypothetical protein